MISSVDKNQVSRQFSRAASSYDCAASLQQAMSEQLICLLEQHIDINTLESIVDLGCGTGYSLKQLTDQYTKPSYSGIDLSQPMLDIARDRVPQAKFSCADIEKYLPEKQTDLYFSNASLQWCQLNQVIENIQLSLCKNGLLAFTSFAPKTHQEISTAWEKIDQLPHRIDFLSLSEHIDLLQNAGFELLETKTELHQLSFENAHSLLKSIKDTGATNAIASRSKGLLSRDRYQQFITELNKPNPVLLTYDVIYILAKKKDICP